MKKKFVALKALMFALMVCCFAQIGIAAGTDISVAVNGKKLKLEQPPVMNNGRVLVPLRGVFEELGATVFYEQGEINCVTKSTSVRISKYDVYDNYYSESYYYYYRYGYEREYEQEYSISINNGKMNWMEDQPIIVNSKMMVPVRVVAEAFGANAGWNGISKTVTITADIPADERLTKEDITTCNAFTIKAAREIAAENSLYRYFEHNFKIQKGYPSYDKGVKVQNLVYLDEDRYDNWDVKVLHIAAGGEVTFTSYNKYDNDYSNYSSPALTSHAKYLPFQERYDGFLGAVAYLGNSEADMGAFNEEYFGFAPQELYEEEYFDVVETPNSVEYFLLFPKYGGTKIVIRELSIDNTYFRKYGDVLYSGTGPVLLRANLMDAVFPNTSVTFTLGKNSVRINPDALSMKNSPSSGRINYINPYSPSWRNSWRIRENSFPSDKVMDLTIKGEEDYAEEEDF